MLIICTVTRQQQHRFSPGTEEVDDDDVGELLPDTPCRLDDLRSSFVASGLYRKGPYASTPRHSSNDTNDRVWDKSPASDLVSLPQSDIRQNPRTPVKQRVLKHYLDGSPVLPSSPWIYTPSEASKYR